MKYKRLLPTRYNNSIKKENTQQTMICIGIDGSCLCNGKKNAKAGIGIFFGQDNKNNISKKIKSSNKITNNIAELIAMNEILKIICNANELNTYYNILSDSLYTINCITKWIKKWEKNGWRTSSGSLIKNKTLIIKTNELYETCKHKISICHVKAHTKNNDKHSVWNRYADELAVKAADLDSDDETHFNTILY